MQAQIKMHFTIANITEPNLRLETAHNEPNLAISKKISTNDGLFFVAVESTDILWTIMAGNDGHRDWLYSVAVYPNKRLSGLGSSLVHHAEKALADLGCMKINL